MTIRICGDVEMVKYRLGDICEIVSGSTPKTGVSEYWDGDKKWITPAEITDESYIITDSVRKLTELGVTKTGLSSFPKGTVILSSRAPIGKVAIAGCEMYCNQGFKNLICSQKIYNRYLYWFLKGNTEYLNSLGRGATFKEISKQIVASIEINVPEMEQQMQAAENLERVSSILRLRKKELQKLDDLVKARFIELFGDPATNPYGWQQLTVNDVCVSVVRGPFGSALKKEFFVPPSDTTYKVYEQKHAIQKSSTIGTYYVTAEKYNELRRFECHSGDILMSCSGTMGELYQLPAGCERGIINQALCKFTPNERILPVVFLAYMRETIGNLESKGSGIPNIAAVSYVKAMPINLPPMRVQEQYATFIEQTDKSKVAVQKALDEAQLLFDSLMQKYFE